MTQNRVVIDQRRPGGLRFCFCPASSLADLESYRVKNTPETWSALELDAPTTEIVAEERSSDRRPWQLRTVLKAVAADVLQEPDPPVVVYRTVTPDRPDFGDAP